MRQRLRSFVLAGVALGLFGCGNPGGNGPVAAADGVQKVRVGEVEGEIVGVPAPRSKFARVRIGMVQRQVEDLIGPPNDAGAHITGKAFIPFYFGGDTARIDAHYRGEGVLSYSSRSFAGQANTLVRIEVNPGDDGYAH